MNCFACSHSNPSVRHQHYLEDFQTDEDLAEHLGKEQHHVAGIVEWRREMHHLYGGMVDDDGSPLTPWQARAQYRQAYNDVYFKASGRFGVEPRAKKRPIALLMFKALLTQAKTDYATAWLDILTNQCPEVESDEGWRQFCELLKEFEANIDPSVSALKTIRKPTVPPVQRHQNGHSLSH